MSQSSSYDSARESQKSFVIWNGLIIKYLRTNSKGRMFLFHGSRESLSYLFQNYNKSAFTQFIFPPTT